MNKIHIINGPNLNLIGEREPEIYGTKSFIDLCEDVKNKCRELNIHATFFQSNHEGAIIDEIQKIRNVVDGIIINPGAYTHYSYAIRDSIAGLQIPVVEVHLSDIYSREDFRKHSVIKDVCTAQITGLGLESYFEGIRILKDIFSHKEGLYEHSEK